jgi:hypothetical protein
MLEYGNIAFEYFSISVMMWISWKTQVVFYVPKNFNIPHQMNIHTWAKVIEIASLHLRMTEK